jgi:hypothetical protein
MSVHEVEFSIPARALGKSDVKFMVRQNGTLLGTLAVSHGSVVWFPKGTSYGCKMGWAKFDKFMKDEATRFEKR